MDINLQTKIGELLDNYPQLEDELIKLSSAFAKLKNPILRRTVAKVTTVQHAAKIAGISSTEMVLSLRKAAGIDTSNIEAFADEALNETKPAWFDESKVKLHYDATAVIDAGGSPMADIIRLATELKAGELLAVKVPFRPEPIMDTLMKKGYETWYDGEKAYFTNK